MIIERHIEWTSPAALWDHFNGPTTASQRRIFRTPAILRFASDDYMQQFIALVQTDAPAMRDLLAVPETWNKPPSEMAPPKMRTGIVGAFDRARVAAVRKLEARQGLVRSATWNATSDALPLKLYQPAHQRYYLVVACLVCRTLGLPDHSIDTTKQERVTFLVRMLQPPTGAAALNPDPLECTELALVGQEWKPVTERDALVEGETQYPLSPLSYTDVDGRRRRLFNGLVPVAKREALAMTKMPNPDLSSTPAAPIGSRQMLLKTQALGPWANLEEVARVAVSTTVSRTDRAPSDEEINKSIRTANEQIQTVSWYVLLDFDRWLYENLRDVWNAIEAQSSAGLTGKARDAYLELEKHADSDRSVTLVAALKAIRGSAAALESVTSVFRENATAGWPSFRFQFVSVKRSFGQVRIFGLNAKDITGKDSNGDNITDKDRRVAIEKALVDAIDRMLPGVVPVRAAAQVNATIYRSPWFTIRCVFERPNCASLKPAVVSDPSASFQMASLFDPDAPARPIRVTMPADTTPAGLRKFDKNTAFVLSNVLCGQMSGIRDLSFGDLIMAVLPWPLHQDLNIKTKPCVEDGIEVGMVCSLSIPIITICALILLMVMVKLLDMIFYWLPFFMICLPVPKFDGKKEL